MHDCPPLDFCTEDLPRHIQYSTELYLLEVISLVVHTFLKTYYHFKLINYIFLPQVIMLKSTKCFKNKSPFVVEVLFELASVLLFNVYMYSSLEQNEIN